ncbi:Serine/threonine-protein kinase dkf-2 [Bienertia sinuspersici]
MNEEKKDEKKTVKVYLKPVEASQGVSEDASRLIGGRSKRYIYIKTKCVMEMQDYTNWKAQQTVANEFANVWELITT